MRRRPLWAISISVLMVACGGDGPSGPSLTVTLDPGTVPVLLVGDDVTLTASVSGSLSASTAIRSLGYMPRLPS